MIEIKSTAEFEKVLNNGKPLLVDFYAGWCAPCKALLPVLEELSVKYQKDIEVVKVNVNDNRELAVHFMVRSIPTLFFIDKGQIVDKLQGYIKKPIFEERIAKIKSKVD